ncbi:hypothetical protein N7468_008440 [Penicillium chermesinum]|uniref:Integral membrane protein n=1 Tax=Penicillium chermesinum TaxID=63820 RepID=A0A9W9NS14_9EURO|nr:uncharacterized protein N7468_008440 [Penicillium chermesinum]KAJ5223898.1 hypothetical protein N7468_008440 [Penicillium chermesinum]KAJ6155277.1 hypothetical protein N7470_005843 [Penicillium chermesinum]
MRSGPVLRLLQQPAVKVLLTAGLVYLLIFEYCSLRFWRDPHSAFFDIRDVFKWKYSLAREQQALNLTSTYNVPFDSALDAVKGRDRPLMCAALATVRRDNADYFEASIGSLLSDLDARERRALHLSILFANTDPTQHPSWGQKWVERLSDSVSSYNVSDAELAHLRELEEKRDYYEKGVYDYVYLLNTCLETGAPYIFILEDDVILADGWMIKTLNGLTELSQGQADRSTAWLYLRLFFTETSLSWQSTDYWYRNMPLAFFLVMVFGLTLLLAVRRRLPASRRWLDNWTLAAVCFIIIPTFTALVYMVGKYSLCPLKGVIEMNIFGCCTQGLVYPREQVPDLIAFLQDRKAGQTDSLIEEYASNSHLTRYAYAPQQIQHVGLKSSRGNLGINTQSTWAFWFEENDPQELKAEHEKLLAAHETSWMLD